MTRPSLPRSLEHAAGRIADMAYLASSARLREELATAKAPRASRVSADDAITAIRGLASSWSLATDEERAHLAHLVYARIPLRGSDVQPVELTPWAYELGIDQAMPELIWLEERPRQESENRVQPATVRVPIAGRRERAAAARRSA
jgi:hypothetical protein